MEIVSPIQPNTVVTSAIIFDFDGVFIDTERLKTLSPATLKHLARIQLGADVFNAMVCEGYPGASGP